MEKTTTSRGFGPYEFVDCGGNVCTVQKSSSALEDKIWLGSKELNIQHFEAGLGWSKVMFKNTIEDHYVANNRMELNRQQVADLLPILQKFVETGEI